MSYVEKYLKYKAKYLSLQDLIGGKLNNNEIDILFELIDSDNSGKISRKEFIDFFMAAEASQPA